MSTRLWKAVLNPSSPRYPEWKKIFKESDDIPLVAPCSFEASLGGETDKVYLLDWSNIADEESDLLLNYFAVKFSDTVDAVQKWIDADGHFPIRESDVTIVYELRAFI